jgi:hypothetical protein
LKDAWAKASWDSLLTARHAIVHNEGGGVVTLAWSDLEECFKNSKLVLQALANALTLTTADIQSI